MNNIEIEEKLSLNHWCVVWSNNYGRRRCRDITHVLRFNLISGKRRSSLSWDSNLPGTCNIENLWFLFVWYNIIGKVEAPISWSRPVCAIVMLCVALPLLRRHGSSFSLANNPIYWSVYDTLMTIKPPFQITITKPWPRASKLTLTQWRALISMIHERSTIIEMCQQTLKVMTADFDWYQGHANYSHEMATILTLTSWSTEGQGKSNCPHSANNQRSLFRASIRLAAEGNNWPCFDNHASSKRLLTSWNNLATTIDPALNKIANGPNMAMIIWYESNSSIDAMQPVERLRSSVANIH